jgi:integrase
VAFGTPGRRYQDSQFPADARTTPDRDPGDQGAPEAQAEDRLTAGPLWQDHGLVFASAIGTPLDAANVRREFRNITEAAGLGAGWAPRDRRHTFVSLMSADGLPIEEIARLAGHNRATTELVYRHELRPVITTGAEVMDRILSREVLQMS